MSHLSPRPEQSTTAEIALLTQLNLLPTTPTGYAIVKNADGTFSNFSFAAGSGTVTSVSVVSANGVSGSVANATTTPAITITLGAIVPISVNGLTISPTTGTLTISGTKTVTFSNTLSFAGTDGTTMTFPGTSATIARTDASNTFTGHQTIEGVTSTGATGTGKIVFDTSPTLSNPTVGTQSTTDNSTLAASTAYVTTAISNAVAGINPAVAVQVATTAAGDTSGLTYVHVAGIGDTFTGAINTAITIDGRTLILGDRVLIKNDTQTTGGVSAGVFNGVYLVTQIQTVAVAPILTRALDYDTPSDINNTGAIPVVLGTANANTSWILTSSISAVGTGTNVLTYASFSLAPSTIVTLTGSQTLTNKILTTPTITKPVLNATNPTAQTYSPAGAGTATLDLSLANQHYITMPAGNITIALSNDTNNQVFYVSILQDGTGSRTVTWFTTIRWAGGTVPTLTTTASKRDAFIFVRTGSGTYDGFVVGQNI